MTAGKHIASKFDVTVSTRQKVRVQDITAVICLRLHDRNPWVMERLASLKGFYKPTPRFLVVDFGSQDKFQKLVESSCKESGFKYIHISDYETFSLSSARNSAVSLTATKFIYFTDIDFITTSDFFQRLAEAANSAEMGQRFDVILDLPAYHLSQATTQKILDLATTDRNDELNKIAYRTHFQKFGKEVEFIAPYSNNFLIAKRYFEYVGGYHSSFRGHGSEDFEFFIRASIISGYYPLPDHILNDWDGPLKTGFFGNKPFGGFRSLNQLHAARAERFGLRTFHLWHPTKRDDSWRTNNDWKREKLNTIAGAYIADNSRLLSVDSIPRQKRAVCICIHKDQYGYFLPLRTLGYQIDPIFDCHPKTLEQLSNLIKSKSIDAFCIFNPYMGSHKHFLPLFLKAKELGIETIVIERGALPKTVYYADDVCYVSNSFTSHALSQIKVSAEEISKTKDYIRKLRSGSLLLEAGEDRMTTDQKYAAFRELKRRKIFIPLQLHDDMAVTKHLRKSQRYDRFVKSIRDVAQANSGVLFLVKPHPLSSDNLDSLPENVLIADRNDNIHSLIDSCDSVICYNSGVGLLAACHGRRLVTIGNAFYNLEGIGHFADSLSDAVTHCLRRAAKPNTERVEQLVAKYLFHLYSWFEAEDIIRDFGSRKSHQYRNIRITRFVFRSHRSDLQWEAHTNPFSKESYGYAMANFRSLHMERISQDSTRIKQIETLEEVTKTIINEKIKRSLTFKVYASMYGPFLSSSQRDRLLSTPADFFQKAHHPASKLGRFLLSKKLLVGG